MATTKAHEVLDLPDHVYEHSGTYELSITGELESPIGLSHSGTSRASIRAARLQATVAGPRFLSEPKAASYTASIDGGTLPYRFDWQVKPTGEFPNHGPQLDVTFDRRGEYHLSLTVTDADNNVDVVAFPVRVQDPNAGVLGVELECPQTKVYADDAPAQFSLRATGGQLINGGRFRPYVGRIAWGDASEEITIAEDGSGIAQHIFSKSGDFTVKVSVYDSTSSAATAECSVVVEPRRPGLCSDEDVELLYFLVDPPPYSGVSTICEDTESRLWIQTAGMYEVTTINFGEFNSAIQCYLGSEVVTESRTYAGSLCPI